jgi:hypothetical protein
MLTDEQLEKVKAFKKKHIHDNLCNNRFIYDIDYPDGLGPRISMKCPLCFNEIELTDFNLW